MLGKGKGNEGEYKTMKGRAFEVDEDIRERGGRGGKENDEKRIGGR